MRLRISSLCLEAMLRPAKISQKDEVVLSSCSVSEEIVDDQTQSRPLARALVHSTIPGLLPETSDINYVLLI